MSGVYAPEPHHPEYYEYEEFEDEAEDTYLKEIESLEDKRGLNDERLEENSGES